MKPLNFGGIPALESTVSAYGYPIGGERMSVTTGIVSRIDFNLYTHSAIDSHLAIQISAQINPGNSGGPVMQNGKVVGVAFQGYSGDIAQGVAYMIPTPVIRRFLKDIEDGHYDRYVDLGITYSKLQNPAQRHFLGLKDDDRGVLVEHRDRRRSVRQSVAERRRPALDRRSSDRERCLCRVRGRAGANAGGGRAEIQGRHGEARSPAK